MTSKYQAGALKNLASFCQNRSFWKTKFALISFYNQRYSDWSEMIIVILEYLQLMSQALLLDKNIYDNPTSDNQFIFGAVVYFFKLVNPSYLLDFSQPNLATAIVLLVLLCATFFKFLLCGYILYMSVFDTKGSHLLANTWKWIFRLQCRVICYFTTSFWIRTLITVSAEEFSINGVNNVGLMAISGLMVAAEYIFSLMIETRLCYVLPTRNFLSGKNYHTQLITLVQKAVMQIAQIAVTADSLGGAWVVSILNLVFTIIRTSQYFTQLPLYNIQALLFQGHLLSAVTSLNVVYFFQTLLRAADYDQANINFVVLAWIFISILAGITSHGFLCTRASNILINSVQGSSEVLVHRVSAMKQLIRNEKRPGQGSELFDMSFLISSSVGINLKRVFGLTLGSLHDLNLNIHDSKDANRVFLQYLESLGTKHPKDSLIKLHIAELCTRNPELYTKAIKIAADLGRSTWSTYSLTSSLLIYEIERAILASYRNETTILDLFTYIKSQMLVDDLRKEMLSQADLKIKVCENILNDVSNVGDIYNCAQLLNKSKTKMQKKMDLFAQIIPHHYIEPLKLCAEYSLILNYSVEDFEKYNNTHSQRYVRYEKQFKSLNFAEENLYQDTNAFLILSGQKVDNGKIVFATRPLQNICGGEKSSYFGTHVSTLFTPSLQNYYNELFRQILDTGKSTVLNQIVPAYLYHKDKYIVQAEFYVRIHPYITENLYLNMMIRPVPLEKEYLLIKEDGEIEGASYGLAKALNITSGINVRALSEELDRVSRAFNTVHRAKMAEGVVELLLSKRKSEKSSMTPHEEMMNSTQYNKAFDIYNTYTTKGHKIELRPIKQASGKRRESLVLAGNHSYHCNVSLIHFGVACMKVVTLDEIGQRDSQEQISRSFVKFKSIDHVINEHKKEEDSMESANVDESVLASENVEEQDQDFASNPNRYVKKEFDLEATDRYGLNSPGLLQSQYRSPLISPSAHRVQADQMNDSKMSDGYILPSASLLASQSRSPLISQRLFNKISVDAETTDVLPSPGQSQKTNPLAKLVTKFTFKKGVTEHAKAPVSLSVSFDSGRLGRDNALKERVKRKAGDARYVSSHHSSQSSQERSFNRSYQRAITSKSYPKSFNILCAVFYIVIIFTLVSQFIMKSTADDTMDKLVVKKDMLKYAQIRQYKTLLLQINARGAGLQIAGAMTSGNIGGSGLSTKGSIELMKTHEEDLVNSNKQMMIRVDSVDEEIRSALFEADIRVKGSLTDTADTKTKNMTQFQLIDEVVNSIETLYALRDTSEVVSLRSYNLMNWLSINTLNDYLYKDNSLTNLFMNSVEREKTYFQNIIVLCLVITPILLGAMAVMLNLIIWYLYTIEKGYMAAFIRLSPSGVKNILASLRMFKKCLVNEEEFQARQSVDSFWNTALAPQDAQDRNYHKKHTTQVIKYGGIRFRYYKYVIKVILYTAVLIGIMLWNFISAELSTNVIYRRQSMLEFANRISARVTTNYATFVELFASNNTNYIAHVPPLDALITGISEMQNIQNSIPSTFLEEDSTYDPDVQAILFVNEGCARISTTHMRYCLLVTGAGQPTNILSTMAFYENSIKGKLQDYYRANKTTIGQVLTAAYINIAIILPTFDVITTQAFTMGNIIDANLMKSISDASDQRVLILIIFTISLVIVSALFWSQILIHLREVNNDFKKVLQVFPPNLILSSFLLKTFLKKTSHIVPDKSE